MDAREYARQSVTETGFWVRRAELMSSHPNLPKRLAALLELGVDAGVPATAVPSLANTTASAAIRP